VPGFPPTFGNEVPYDERRAEDHRLAEDQHVLEAARRNKEVANRRVNNDGPAIAGGLCLGCFATERAAEARADRDEYTQRICELLAQQAKKWP